MVASISLRSFIKSLNFVWDISKTTNFNLSSDQITADNTTIFPSLYVSGVNVLSSINNINSSIGTSNSSLNITGATKITFNAGGLASTYVDSSGVNVFHTEWQHSHFLMMVITM